LESIEIIVNNVVISKEDSLFISFFTTRALSIIVIIKSVPSISGDRGRAWADSRRRRRSSIGASK